MHRKHSPGRGKKGRAVREKGRDRCDLCSFWSSVGQASIKHLVDTVSKTKFLSFWKFKNMDKFAKFKNSYLKYRSRNLPQIFHFPNFQWKNIPPWTRENGFTDFGEPEFEYHPCSAIPWIPEYCYKIPWKVHFYQHTWASSYSSKVEIRWGIVFPRLSCRPTWNSFKTVFTKNVQY